MAMRSTRNKYVGVSSPASGEIPRRRQTLSSDALYDVFHNAGRQGASPFAGTRRHLMSAQGLAQRDDATSSCASCFVVRVTKTRGCALHSRIVSEPGYLFTVGVEMEGHYVRSPSGHQGQTRREVGTQSLRSWRTFQDSGAARWCVWSDSQKRAHARAGPLACIPMRVRRTFTCARHARFRSLIP